MENFYFCAQRHLFIYLAFYLRKITCRGKPVSELLIEEEALGLPLVDNMLVVCIHTKLCNDLKILKFASYKGNSDNTYILYETIPFFCTLEVQENPTTTVVQKEQQELLLRSCT